MPTISISTQYINIHEDDLRAIKSIEVDIESTQVATVECALDQMYAEQCEIVGTKNISSVGCYFHTSDAPEGKYHNFTALVKHYAAGCSTRDAILAVRAEQDAAEDTPEDGVPAAISVDTLAS